MDAIVALLMDIKDFLEQTPARHRSMAVRSQAMRLVKRITAVLDAISEEADAVLDAISGEADGNPWEGSEGDGSNNGHPCGSEETDVGEHSLACDKCGFNLLIAGSGRFDYSPGDVCPLCGGLMVVEDE